METIWNLIVTNKEWLFSGILVLPMTFIYKNVSLRRFLKSKDVDISGEWQLKYLSHGEGIFKINQLGNRIWGVITVTKTKSGRDAATTDREKFQPRTFKIKGQIVANRIIGTYEDKEFTNYSVGTIILAIDHSRKKMDGKVCFFDTRNNTNHITDYDIQLFSLR